MCGESANDGMAGMRIADIRVDEGGSGSIDRVRLSARVEYRRLSDPETIWWEVDSAYGDAFSLTSDSFLACLFPLACLLGESIELDSPVSAELVEQCHQVMSVWQGWYPWLKWIGISPSSFSQAKDAGDGPDTRITAQFFSGGADSFFTLLHAPPPIAPHDLIQVFGFDIPLESPEENDVRLNRAKAISRTLEKNVVEVKTNLMKTSFRLVPWGKISHGAAFAAVAHALSNRYKCAIISSSHDNHHLIPWGSHPVTDPLFGTKRTRILHYGADFTRVEKLRFLSGFDLALDNLHVCYHEASARNCGRCEKCLRTMISLDLLGKLDDVRSFPVNPNPLEDYLAISLERKNARIFARELSAMALERGRPETAKRIDEAISRGQKAEILSLFKPGHFCRALVNHVRTRFPALVPPLRRLRGTFQVSSGH